jgi:CHAT domain-containing protein/Tfp pilus assembly protein PilF
MFRRVVSHFISNNLVSKSLWTPSIALAVSFLSLIVVGHVQAGVDASSPVPLQEQDAQGVVTLELGKPVERELVGRQKHSYQITLAEGQYANVTVDQRGVDIVAHLFAADGQLIADVDSERTAQGTERIELVAETAGNYRIEIEPSVPKAGVGTYEVQLSEVREATTGEKLLHEARRQYYESLRLNESGKTDKALDLANRALATREKVLGASHTDVAASLRSLGALYESKEDLTRAEAFLKRAEEATAKTSGAESLDYADVLHGLARIRFIKGDLAQAEQLTRRTLSIREKAAGPDSLAAASSLFSLAVLYRASNDLPQAEQLYLRVLAIREKLLGADHVEVSYLLNNLGLLYYGVGDYSKAEPIFQRSLAIKERVLAPNHRQVGITLNNLGLVEWKRRNYEKAEAYYQRALSIFEKATGSESDGVAGIFHNLGIIYKEAGQNYAKAEEYYQRALAIWEKIFGEYNSGTGDAVSSLGILYEAMGDYDRAEKFQLRALAIRERVQGPNNQYTVLVLRNLAKIYAIKGDINRSIEYQRRISAIEEKIIPLNLTIGSERQKITYFTQLQRPDRVISFHVRLAHDNEAARDLAATTVLQRKGRVLDALSENLSALRLRFNTQDQALLDSLSDINSRLARLVLSKPQKMSLEEHQNQIKNLEGERERLEAEISRRSAGFYEGSQPVTLAAVRAAIPSDAALVEFAVYRPFDWKAAEDKTAYGEPRYVAYVLRRQGGVQWKELGAAKEIDSSIDALRQALRDPHRKDAQQLARTVDEKVMQPIRPLVGDAAQLLISPDGALNLIPFEALVDEQNRYLVERFSCTYLTSGRDLVRLQVARASKSNPVVLADPLFGEPVIAQAVKPDAPRARQVSLGKKRQSITTADDLSSVYFAPLGGTAEEARAIKSLFVESNVLTGSQATVFALKRVDAPRILHIATHGFFLQDAASATTNAAANANVGGTRGINASVKIENPLLRSGLALAGANLNKGNSDDGILTALEASGLNLWGTKLVTLSACDTGLGEVKNGEGVYGLRRAFVLAGTETLVMSLWPVSDYVTREMMTAYYKGLKQGRGRGEALRKVQLSMLTRKDRQHPFYWASFIQSGEWANLEGKR